MLSRWFAIGLIWRLRYVRVGDSKARPFAGNLSGGEWLVSGAIGALAVVAAASLCRLSPGVDPIRTFGIAGLAAAAMAVAAATHLQPPDRRLHGRLPGGRFSN